MLLERLGPSLADLRRPDRQRLTILTSLAASVWRPAPDGSGLMNGLEKAVSLIEFAERTNALLGRPCPEVAIDYALECATRRAAAHRPESAVLNHGDVHQWNALQTQSGFALVDPDGLVAEPEYDLGVILREDPMELLSLADPWQRAADLAAPTGCDVVAIWEWAAIERVSTGLTLLQVGLDDVASDLFEAASCAAHHRTSDLVQ